MIRSTTDIRKTFLKFFESKGHQIIASSSLVPENDPTLLFTNAGMNQFKNIFLGINKSNYSRVATSQRCVRTGGKHDDLKNVGYTTRHHTFFEMLGNFSFGDYFKYEAIKYAWELLTSKNWFNISKERILVTVYESDYESYMIWKKEIGIPTKRIIRIGDNGDTSYISDNFWYMGDTGPCGPCTEIFYDRGNHILGELPGSIQYNNNDRYLEIWNIVFMQFNRQADGTMTPLVQPYVDTGMGLERIATILQFVNSNYEIDLFRTLIRAVMEVTNSNDLNNKSLYVIADHIRSCAFLIAEGVTPSNEGRGYVLRRIIRRAIRHGNMLGVEDTFFYKLVDPLIYAMDTLSINLKSQQMQIEKTLKNEEEQFSRTLKRGLILLNKELKKLKSNTLDGKIVFNLYDTHGLPVDLIEDICHERNIKVDKVGFEKEMEKQRYFVRKNSNVKINPMIEVNIDNISEFKGYDHMELNSTVKALFIDNNKIDKINFGQEAIVFLDRTPFYARSGGQVGDKGELHGHNFIFKVNDTKKYGQAIGHLGKLSTGFIKIGDYVKAIVNKEYRINICLNHSAVHLMHSALRNVIGNSVVQQGSLINDKTLRLDFSYFKAIGPSEIRTIENLVNTQIRRNLLIETNLMKLEAAKNKGAISLFDNKYHEYVRVVSIGDFSIELCCGTHALRTGDIGLFHIISERSVAAGVRRIEAVTGDNALSHIHLQSDQLQNIATLLKSKSDNLNSKLISTFKYIKNLEKELRQLKKQIVLKESTRLTRDIIEVKGVKLLVSELTNIGIEYEDKLLRDIVQNLKSRLDSIIVVLATITEDRIFLVVGVSQNLIKYVKAKELVSILAHKVDGSGGGNFDIAQISGTNVTAFHTVLDIVKNWILAKF